MRSFLQPTPLRHFNHSQLCTQCSLRFTCTIGRLPLSEQAREKFALREQSLRRGDLLTEQGCISEDLVILKVGQVLIYRQGVDSTKATTGGRACRVSLRQLAELSSQDEAVKSHLCHHTFETQATLLEWLELISQSSVMARLATFLVLLAESGAGQTHIRLPSHATLAKILGLSRESVARGLRLLEHTACISKTSMGQYDVSPRELRKMLKRVSKSASQL